MKQQDYSHSEHFQDFVFERTDRPAVTIPAATVEQIAVLARRGIPDDEIASQTGVLIAHAARVRVHCGITRYAHGALPKDSFPRRLVTAEALRKAYDGRRYQNFGRNEP